MTKAITLLSGGLDSILATKLILEQGIEVEAVNFDTGFAGTSASLKAANNLGIKLKTLKMGEEYFDIIKNPKYGHGKNINPCLDCHILFVKKAGEYMKKTGASFIITGEVLGQRPMSQRKEALNIVSRDSGMAGFLLRPLSAKILKPTIPEQKGYVEREKLLGISGRSRKIQMQLAKKLGITYYQNPAGGCLLTDPGFSKRMRDLIKHKPNFTIEDIEILKVGRHFRLSENAKLVVGRDEKENEKLLKLAHENDLNFHAAETAGPTGIARGKFNGNTISKAASIVARYSDGGPEKKFTIEYRETKNKITNSIQVLPMEEKELKTFRI